jgi:hypothetical protein
MIRTRPRSAFRPQFTSDRGTASAFWGPIYLLIDEADGGDEQHALDLLAGHVRHFRRTHLKEA